jgi:ATP-dependent Clp protease protease subunit
MTPDILIVGEICHSTLVEVFPILIEADRQPSKKPICIRMTSQGGAATSGLALYDAIKLCKRDTRIEGFGECSSVATLVLQAADWRVVTEHTRILLHNGQAEASGTTTGHSMRNGADEILRTDKLFHRLMAAKSHRCSSDFIADLCAKESYLTAAQALEYDLVDEVLYIE